MEISEETAYAIAAWHRFDEAVSDQLVRAVAGAYALIICSDGEIAGSEVESFVASVITGGRLPKVDASALERAFRALCEAVMSDGQGRGRAFDAVRAVRGEPRLAELVSQAAKLAVAADGVVREAEQRVLAEIDEALGASSPR